jgi:DNA-binding transcriptional LysR family regulator
MDKLASIRAFIKVVQLGSFSAAAREMRLSRAAVSKQVIDLEEELGVQLLHRTTRSTSPTASGAAYYERCAAILTDLEEADLAVSSAQVEPRGTLRVNAPMSFGTLHLGHAISTFMDRYPKLQIEFVLSDEMIDPVRGGFDVTLRIAESPSPSLSARKIAPAPRVLCASPSYLQQRGRPAHAADLRNHACLSYGHLATGQQWKLTGADGDHWITVPWMLCTNNAEILRDAAIAGQGIALLPTFIADADLRAGRLATVLTDFRAPDLWLYALYPASPHLPVKVRVFIDFMVRQLSRDSAWRTDSK